MCKLSSLLPKALPEMEWSYVASLGAQNPGFLNTVWTFLPSTVTFLQVLRPSDPLQGPAASRSMAVAHRARVWAVQALLLALAAYAERAMARGEAMNASRAGHKLRCHPCKGARGSLGSLG